MSPERKGEGIVELPAGRQGASAAAPAARPLVLNLLLFQMDSVTGEMDWQTGEESGD